MTTKIATVLHDATHRVPGIPAHDDAANNNAAHRGGLHPRLKSRNAHHDTAHHDTAPRVLVAWQNWIAKLAKRSEPS